MTVKKAKYSIEMYVESDWYFDVDVLGDRLWTLLETLGLDKYTVDVYDVKGEEVEE